MSTETYEHGPAPQDMSTEEMERLLRAAGMPAPVPPNRSSLRRKLVVAVLVAGVGVGASVMSCVGQSFSLRQARAMEGIQEQLTLIQQSCAIHKETP